MRVSEHLLSLDIRLIDNGYIISKAPDLLQRQNGHVPREVFVRDTEGLAEAITEMAERAGEALLNR